ncbi:hypothetical protein ACVXG7_16000 [Enterobacter hormaechei]
MTSPSEPLFTPSVMPEAEPVRQAPAPQVAQPPQPASQAYAQPHTPPAQPPQPQFQQPAPQPQESLIHPLLMRNGDSRPLQRPVRRCRRWIC